jgi:hypothetical protein
MICSTRARDWCNVGIAVYYRLHGGHVEHERLNYVIKDGTVAVVVTK